jgi:hypothetical protein
MAEPTIPVRRQTPHGAATDADRTGVREEPRRTPAVADVDVLVVGGGPAGVGAALAAGRQGARTLLVERHGMLGGMWTAGMVNPFFEFRRKGWIVAELIERLQTEGAWRPHPHRATFDYETMVRLLETMMAEAGVDFWYHVLMTDTIVEDGVVRGALLESKAGREAVLARVVVDCTGDGDVAARAGVPYEMGRLQDGLVQPMTLMFEVDGTGDYEQRSGTYDRMLKAIQENDLGVELPFGRVSNAPAIILLPHPGTAIVQATHVYRLNPLDPRELTRGIVAARVQARDLTRVLACLPGLGDVRLVHTAPTIGVRESRRIRGLYRLTLEDAQAGRRFEDSVTFCAFPVDVHEPAPGAGIPSGDMTPMKPYEVPYRCLLPDGVGNLLVAGRCISGSHEAHASYRVTGTCMAMGQAAGLAAAWSAAENRPPAALPGAELHAALREKGAGMLDDWHRRGAPDA